jgi:cell division protein FtsB
LKLLEPKEKLNQDYLNFNQAIEQQARREIEKIRADVDALKAQVTKVGEALMNSTQVSEKVS